MKVSRRNQYLAGIHLIALAGLFDIERATGVKTLGKKPREQRRHVLHNKNRQWKSSRQIAARSAPSAAGPPVETPMTTTLGRAEYAWHRRVCRTRVRAL